MSSTAFLVRTSSKSLRTTISRCSRLSGLTRKGPEFTPQRLSGPRYRHPHHAIFPLSLHCEADDVALLLLLAGTSAAVRWRHAQF